MNVTILGWREALGTLHGTWSDWIASLGFNPSLHPDWMNALLEAWQLDRAANVAVLEKHGQTIGIIPFSIRTRTLSNVPCRTLEFCSNVNSYHAEVLCTGDVAEALDAFLRSKALPKWDALRVVNTVAGGRTSSALRRLSSVLPTLSIRDGERSPYVAIDSDWNTYLQGRSKKVRANITRSQRLMQAAGETGLYWYERGCDPAQLLEDMLEIEAQSWKAAAGIAIVRGTPQCAYYERLLPWLARQGMLANVLYVKSKPVAYSLCAAWHGWFGQLKTSYSSELRDAGSRVIDTSLERAFALGAKEYDFLGDAAPHKLRWTDRIRAHEEVWLFASHLRGRALGAIKRVSDRWYERQAKREAAAALPEAQKAEA